MMTCRKKDCRCFFRHRSKIKIFSIEAKKTKHIYFLLGLVFFDMFLHTNDVCLLRKEVEKEEKGKNSIKHSVRHTRADKLKDKQAIQRCIIADRHATNDFLFFRSYNRVIVFLEIVFLFGSMVRITQQTYDVPRDIIE